jgi:hypothetical protein
VADVKRQDQEPVALVELLDAAAVATPGQLVDVLHERGDAIVVDPLWSPYDTNELPFLIAWTKARR